MGLAVAPSAASSAAVTDVSAVWMTSREADAAAVAVDPGMTAGASLVAAKLLSKIDKRVVSIINWQ